MGEVIIPPATAAIMPVVLDRLIAAGIIETQLHTIDTESTRPEEDISP
jgi:hypothetical protein